MMDDLREKVIKGLEKCTNEAEFCGGEKENSCPYFYDYNCRTQMEKDALELLKVQESFKPFRSGVYHPDWCCGNCKYPGLYGRMKFCPECGKAVKWE